MPISDLDQLLENMSPKLNPELLVMVSLPGEVNPELVSASLAIIKEIEGTTLVLPLQLAQHHKLSFETVFNLISLEVESDLLAVGLTAAFATALGQAGIPANVLAGFYHDHILVPNEMANSAIEVLNNLSRASHV